MKVTGFCPMIITKCADPLIKLYEELGFAVIHKKENIDGLKTNRSLTMKNPDGFRVVITETQAQDVPESTALRINVDDFDEAYDLLKQNGFKNYFDEAQDLLIKNGFNDNFVDHIIKTDSSISALMISPSGFAINVIKHIKKSERTAEE